MNRSICWLTLDMNRRDGQCSVSLGQGETGRTLKFRLYENGEPYTIPEGCYVIISGVMNNNHDGVSEYVIYNDCYIQDGVVCYDITDATALGTVGVMNCQLQIVNVDSGCVFVCSPKFQIVVHSAVYDKETVESSEQFFALQKILEGLSQGGGGMEIVTIENGKPSMSAKEIYDKFQNGTMVLLSYQTPSGISVLMDLESVSQTTAAFKHTHVDPISKNATTYTIEVYSNTYTLLTTTQSLEGLSQGGGNMEIVTVSGTTPSMTSQEIYEKRQNGTMIWLSYGLPNGNFVLMDLESVSEVIATFKHTEVDPATSNTVTYIATIFGGMCQISTDRAKVLSNNPLTLQENVDKRLTVNHWHYLVINVNAVPFDLGVRFVFGNGFCRIHADGEYTIAIQNDGRVTVKDYGVDITNHSNVKVYSADLSLD